MKPPCLPASLWQLQCGICVVNFWINGLLMWLIWKRTSKELLVYSRILFCICWFDLLYTSAGLLIDTRNAFRNGLYVVVVNGPLGWVSKSLAWNNSMIMIQTYVFCLMTVILSVPFIYRYFVICWGNVMTSNQFALLVGIVGIVPTVYPLNYYVQLWPSSQRILDTEQTALAGMPCEDPGQVVLYKESERQSFMGTSSQIITFSLLATSYVVIVGSSLAIVVKTRHKVMSQRVQTANKQITYVLTLQALTPFVFFVLPLASTYLALWFNWDFNQYIGILLTYGYAAFPSLNACYTIVFVKRYRRSVASMICCQLSISVRRQVEPTSSAALSTPQTVARG